MRGDVIAFVAVFNQRSLPAFIARIRQAWNQHAAGQGIDAVRTDGAASGLLEVRNRFYVTRPGWVSVHVEYENLAALKTAQPELPAIIREAAMVRCVAAADRVTVNDLPVFGRTGLGVDDNQFV